MLSAHDCLARSYGEKGYAILHTTLLKIFRPIFVANPLLVHDVDADTFISKVLVPKLAAELIQEDRRCTAAEAVQVLFSSAQFGKDAYPLEDEDDMGFAAEAAAGVAKEHAVLLHTLTNVGECSRCTKTLTSFSVRAPPHPRPVKKTTPSTAALPSQPGGVVIKQEDVIVRVPAALQDETVGGFKVGRTADGNMCFELLSDDDM